MKLTVDVTLENGKRLAPSIRFVDLKTGPVGYGTRKTSYASRYRQPKIGFWFPVGLVGAHFKNVDEKGLSFSSAPLAFAVGSKFFFQGSSVGISAFLGYSLFQGVKEEEIEVTDDAESEETETKITKPFSVTGLTTGLLLDFADLVMVGIGYSFDLRRLNDDLRDTYKNPGISIYLGLPIGFRRDSD